jgi:hypothetical protein
MKGLLPIPVRNWLKQYAWKWVYYPQLSHKGKKANEWYLQQLHEGTRPGAWNLFTKEGEDGILLHIFHSIGTTNKQFADIGSNDCINSNCANLALHHYWNGVFIDADANALRRGYHIYSRYLGCNASRFRFVPAVITTENADQLLQQQGVLAEPDLMCIDLDGNDYHIWKSIESIRPRVVVTEVQIEKGKAFFVPEHMQDFEPFEDGTPKGASATAMVALGREKGYTLVAANAGKYNLFFVRNDCLHALQPLTVEELFEA